MIIRVEPIGGYRVGDLLVPGERACWLLLREKRIVSDRFRSVTGIVLPVDAKWWVSG